MKTNQNPMTGIVQQAFKQPKQPAQKPPMSSMIQKQYAGKAQKSQFTTASKFNSMAKGAGMNPQDFANHVINNASKHSSDIVNHAKSFKNNSSALAGE